VGSYSVDSFPSGSGKMEIRGDPPYISYYAVRARRFSNWTYEEKTPPRTQMFDLMHLARKWLQPEHQSPTQIVETLVLDKFLRGLPRSLREWVEQGNPEEFLQAEDSREHTTVWLLRMNMF
uniref:SCAN box domain-containing protein n=1 Tax=Leptobrachium leishanense TaxID=445787 RepID=A0A8C5MLZ8_9ANUR